MRIHIFFFTFSYGTCQWLTSLLKQRNRHIFSDVLTYFSYLFERQADQKKERHREYASFHSLVRCSEQDIKELHSAIPPGCSGPKYLGHRPVPGHTPGGGQVRSRARGTQVSTLTWDPGTTSCSLTHWDSTSPTHTTAVRQLSPSGVPKTSSSLRPHHTFSASSPPTWLLSWRNTKASTQTKAQQRKTITINNFFQSLPRDK